MNVFETYKGYTFPTLFLPILDVIKDFEVYDDDIWICSFPKTGTTWTQEMVWMITHDVDFESAKVDNEIRMPYLEASGYYHHFIDKKVEMAEYMSDSIGFAKNAPRPRIIKTHLPFELLPEQIQTFKRTPKIIHVYRNYKDTCVSGYYHMRLFGSNEIPFDIFWKMFLNGTLVHGPMVNAVKSFWQHKANPNFHFLRYEDMKKDLRSEILKMCKFLNKSLTEENINQLMEHLSFDKMKKNPHVDKHVVIDVGRKSGAKVDMEGHFFREGKSGAYQSHITPEIERAFDEYLKEQLADTDLQL